MDLANKSDTEILAIADPIMDSLMNASTAIDYDRHTRDFTQSAKGVLSRERSTGRTKDRAAMGMAADRANEAVSQ